jgi:hypothetical protein
MNRTLVLSLLVPAAAIAQVPTFYKDVAPVLERRCQECHRPGEIAPMSLLTYQDARPWAKSIKEKVLTHQMPPWFADPHVGKFANDRSLTKAEIDTLVGWVDGGATAGNPKDAPAPLEFTGGWTIGKPDQILDTGVDFKVPASGTVDYTYFVVPTGFTEDKWVKDLEVLPGNKSVVHHIVLYARPKGSRYVQGAMPGVPFAPAPTPINPARRPPQGDRATLYGINGGAYEMVGVYVPGGVAYRTRADQARLIPAGSDLVFQIHYTANGQAASDRSKVGITFAKQAPKERVVNAFLMNETLRIPPGDANHRVDAKLTLQREVRLQSMFPHMHLRGKAFEYSATLPNGETRQLLSVPQYNFNWQLTYDLDQPLTLPAGSQLQATAFYDNSPNNKYNPDPAKEVFWGDQTWEEMLAGFVDLAIPAGVNPTDIVRAGRGRP